MRSDVKETILRSLEIKEHEKNFPKKQRKSVVKEWLREKDWDTVSEEQQKDLETMSWLAKVAASRTLLRQITRYGYAWLPDTLKKSGRRIAITTPILMTMNMAVRLSLIPFFFASNLPKSPTISFALYSLVTVAVHENEVRILKKTPLVVNQYVNSLSLFFSPRVASLLFRAPNYLSHLVLLLRPDEVDGVVSAYLYYALMWFAMVEGLGASAVYQLKDRHQAEEGLSQILD